MSNNSHTHPKQSLLQKHITSPLIFDQLCPNSILNYDTNSLEKCPSCTSTYSNTNVPRCLPCSHTVCGRCILEKMGRNTVCCGVCQNEYQYLIESNGFLIGNDNNIKVFNDEDELINANEQAHISIHEILCEEVPMWMNPLTQFFKDVKNDEVKIINKESVPKPVINKEFSYKCPTIKSDEKLDAESQNSLCQAAKMLDLELAKTDIYVDKFKRSVDIIILEAKKRNYRLDMGHDVESIQELLQVISTYQPHTPLYKEIKTHRNYNHKKHIESTNDKNVILCRDPFEKQPNMYNKSSLFPSMNIKTPMEHNISSTNIKLKANDYLICHYNNCNFIMDGFYTQIASPTVSFEFHKRYKVCFRCYEKHSNRPYGYDELESLSPLELQEIAATHFCPSQLVGLCLKHALTYKVKYPDLNMFATVDKKLMNKQYEQNKEKISALLLTLMRSQYAVAFDKLKMPLDSYLPHKY